MKDKTTSSIITGDSRVLAHAPDGNSTTSKILPPSSAAMSSGPKNEDVEKVANSYQIRRHTFSYIIILKDTYSTE